MDCISVITPLRSHQQDYDEEQLERITRVYAETPSNEPCFLEMPFQSTLGLNIFGKGRIPQEDESNLHYLGKRINVEVGQLLIVSCMLWHATALPCPIYSRFRYDGVKEDGKPHVSLQEHWITCHDYRLHFYFGCNDTDVNDQNLSLPPRESGMTQSTTYTSPLVNNFTKDYVLKLSKTIFKDQQIDQKVKVVCDPIPRNDKLQSNN